jgi:hypothetical protein
MKDLRWNITANLYLVGQGYDTMEDEVGHGAKSPQWASARS